MPPEQLALLPTLKLSDLDRDVKTIPTELGEIHGGKLLYHDLFTNGIIYQSLCTMLDLPVYAVNIPRQFILAYFDTFYDFTEIPRSDDYRILFFIDPIQGQIYSHQDVEGYLKRMSVPLTPSYYQPLSNKRIIQFLLEELTKCFQGEKEAYRREELLNLIKLLGEKE